MVSEWPFWVLSFRCCFLFPFLLSELTQFDGSFFSLNLHRLPKIKAWIDENNPGDQLIPFSVSLEERLFQTGSDEAAAEELKTLGENLAPALPKITKAGYDGLDLIRYFTCGPDEVRAWTIRKGTLAPQAAGVIHSGEFSFFGKAKKGRLDWQRREGGLIINELILSSTMHSQTSNVLSFVEKSCQRLILRNTELKPKLKPPENTIKRVSVKMRKGCMSTQFFWLMVLSLSSVR